MSFQRVAAVYRRHGSPLQVLEVCSEMMGSSHGRVTVDWLASPINPADLNQMEGVYPVRPDLPAVAGNEGVGRVREAMGKFKAGDWVVPARAGLGTWCSTSFASEEELVLVPSSLPLLDAASITVNPATAYMLLRSAGSTDRRPVVVQNAATSAVGQAVIQIAKHWGIDTVNVIRGRETEEDTVNTKDMLLDLGASVVLTEDEAASSHPDSWIEGRRPTLALNAVGGRSATNLARSLDHNGIMVTYGGMSRKPFTLSTAPFIFKNIQLQGFWMSRWRDEHALQEWEEVLQSLCGLIEEGHLRGRYQTFPLSQAVEALEAPTVGCRKKVLTMERES